MSQIDVRFATLDNGRQEFDEVVASNATVHLEKMSDGLFALIVETTRERACFHIFKKGLGHIDASTFFHEPRNAHAEAQRRRWNRTSAEAKKRHGKRVWQSRRSER